MVDIALLQALQDHRAHQAASSELSALSASLMLPYLTLKVGKLGHPVVRPYQFGLVRLA